MKSSSAFEFEPLAADATLQFAASPGVRVQQATDVLTAARAEADQIRETARQEGFQIGYAAGVTAAEHGMQSTVEALGQAIAVLGEERLRACEAVELRAIELAVRLAEKTLGAALEVRPEHVVDIVRGGLRRLLERDRVLVLVHPDDLETVRKATGELKASLGGIGDLEVQAERRVARGGAIVRTATGEVDGRLDTQLERAREALVSALTGDAA